tara:strand:- start:415 stop:729 length:315 start_codon:yes stop_codon:yes gene_type:complete
MFKFIFNKGKPEIAVEPHTPFNIAIDEEAVISEAMRIAKEEYVAKLADNFLQTFISLEPAPKTGRYRLYFDQYVAASEQGYKRCYNDMKEKLISMIEKEIDDGL